MAIASHIYVIRFSHGFDGEKMLYFLFTFRLTRGFWSGWRFRVGVYGGGYLRKKRVSICLRHRKERHVLAENTCYSKHEIHVTVNRQTDRQ